MKDPYRGRKNTHVTVFRCLYQLYRNSLPKLTLNAFNPSGETKKYPSGGPRPPTEACYPSGGGGPKATSPEKFRRQGTGNQMTVCDVIGRIGIQCSLETSVHDADGLPARLSSCVEQEGREVAFVVVEPVSPCIVR